MAKIKIIFDEKACIGAGICEALSPELWKVVHGKANLKGAKPNQNQEKHELVVDDSKLKLQSEVAAGCPSNAIKVVKI